jgi:hypothetical protein
MVMNHFEDKNFLAVNEKAGVLRFFLLGFGGKGADYFWSSVHTLFSLCSHQSLKVFPSSQFIP